MKQKISVSIEEEAIEKLEELFEDGRFRNKSHIIEFALNKFMEEENGR